MARRFLTPARDHRFDAGCWSQRYCGDGGGRDQKREVRGDKLQEGPAPNERGNRASISDEGEQSRTGWQRTLYIFDAQRGTTQFRTCIRTVLC